MIVSASEWVLGERSVAFVRAQAAGFTAIELDAILGVDLERLQGDLSEHQLIVPSLCWSWNPDGELGSPDASSRLAAQRYLLAALEQAKDLGVAQLVVIPACRDVPWTADEPRIRGIERAAESISAVLADAPAEVEIALESLRREESFLMNTLDEADELRRMVDDPRARILADVYHMAHEEADPVEALLSHVDDISLLHFAAPERGPLLATSPGIEPLVDAIRAATGIRSMTLEYDVGDDDELLVRSRVFARSI